MKYFYLLIFICFLGCSHRPKNQSIQYSAPTGYIKVSEHVQKAATATSKAKAKIEGITARGVMPNDPILTEVHATLTEVNIDLTKAQAAIDSYKSEVQMQTESLNTSVKEKNAALDRVEYWHDKQIKAIGKLWFWRSVSGALAAIITVYIGFLVWRKS